MIAVFKSLILTFEMLKISHLSFYRNRTGHNAGEKSQEQEAEATKDESHCKDCASWLLVVAASRHTSERCLYTIDSWFEERSDRGASPFLVAVQLGKQEADNRI
jgi:hypothetical protein